MPLKAEPDIQAQLLDLQALDTRLQQLHHLATNLPELKTLRTLAIEADAIGSELKAHSGTEEDARLELSRVEADVAVVAARIERDTARIDSSSSVKDVAGLERELEGLRQRRDDLEEIQLNVMERLEESERLTAEIRARLDEVNLRIAASEGERDIALIALTSEQTHAAANRSTIAAKLPPDLFALYERQRARYGFGASLLQGGVSLASGVKLNSNDLVAIREAAPDDVIICPDSQAILVRTAQSGL